MTAADPRPSKRIVDPTAGRAKLVLEGCCRLCGRTCFLQRHHLVARSQGGDDTDHNLVPLCDLCHEAVERRRPGWRVRLRLVLTDAELDYCDRKRGSWWTAKHYPEAA